VIVTKRDTCFECDCCWQKEKKEEKTSLSLLPLFAGVLTIDNIMCNFGDICLTPLIGLLFLVTNIPLGAYLLRLGAHFWPLA
jgi:hypothetical protein